MKDLDFQKQQERRLNRWAYALSAVVVVLVAVLHQVKIDVGISFRFLPPVYSALNAATAVLLIAALYFIKNGNMEMHRRMIYSAIGTSILFLGGYVLYHLTTPETRFGGTGIVRTIYLLLLITHIILAAGILPFILLTFIRAYTGQFERHKKMARWVFPFWLYVAVTGPICYLMLRPYYPTY